MRLLRKLFVYVVEAYAVWSLRRYIRRHPMQDFVDSFAIVKPFARTAP